MVDRVTNLIMIVPCDGMKYYGHLIYGFLKYIDGGLYEKIVNVRIKTTEENKMKEMQRIICFR